jgi:putative ABC transport system permease protein
MIVFACVIAAGVIYNGLRISLSERGRELASLRVLGFTRREVAVILLGEQGILLLLALPVGLVLGYGLSALMPLLLNTELYRLPLILTGRTYLTSAGVVALTGLGSSLLVGLRLRALDLVAVLKSRE